MKKILNLLLAVGCVMSACHKDSPTNTITTPPQLPSSGNLYIAGTTGSLTNTKAVYWKNDTMINLTQPGVGNYATSIALSGSDIYIAGGKNYVTGYWKDGNFIGLDSTGRFDATAIVLSGTDVYVLTTPLDTGIRAQYFKNGLLTLVATDTFNFSSTAMAVSGSDVYICGLISTGTGYVAAYYKNGVLTRLTDGTRRAQANSIFISGSDVYVSGFESDLTGNHLIAKYWKNGTPVALSDSSNLASAGAITVSGSDVYVAGIVTPGSLSNYRNYSVATYWKNGQEVTVTDTTAYYSPTSIAVSGSDVFETINVSPINGSGPTGARYTKNTTMVTLGSTSDNCSAWQLCIGQ